MAAVKCSSILYPQVEIFTGVEIMASKRDKGVIRALRSVLGGVCWE